MEKNKSLMWKSAMNAGAMVGLSLIIYTLILYFLNLTTSSVAGYLGYIILIIGIYLTGKYYRDKILEGNISYGTALGYGVMVCLFASIILAFFTFIQLKYIDPGLIDKQLQIIEDKMVQKGIPESQIEMSINMTKKLMTAEIAPFIVIVSYVFWGLILSLITSAFIKKEGNPFQSATQDVIDDKLQDGSKL